jgi:hypothetical protein
MVKLIILILTLPSFLSGVFLLSRAAMAIRDHMPLALRGYDTFAYGIHYYAFDRTVPRSVQRQYLIACILMPITTAGLAILFHLGGSNKGAMVFGAISGIGIGMSIVNWRRFRSASATLEKEND